MHCYITATQALPRWASSGTWTGTLITKKLNPDRQMEACRPVTLL